MSPNPADNSPAPIGPGSRVDKFEIIEQIGAGGSSIVWKAHDRLLNQFVAVKQVSPEGDIDDELRDRFRAETRMQKRIASQHRHLVRIIDVIDEQRGLFIVMEFVDGPSLEQLLAQRRKPLDQRHALGIIAATAVALEAIHKQNVVHRDLKPSNILLPKSGGLKVCDFGLAAMSDVQEQMSVGTVRYMAPEMFLNEKLDGRADLYALGMVAYEMLAGREQFESAFKLVLRDHRNQALRWMKWHTNPRAMPPALSQLNPEVPQTLSDLVARMMEKDRDKRISSADEVVEAIRRHFAGEPVGREQLEAAQQHQPAGDDAPTAAVPRRGRMKLVLAASLGLMMLLGVGILSVQGMERGDQQRRVFQEARQSYHQASEAMAEALDPADGDIELAKLAELMQQFNEMAAIWPQDLWLSKWSLARATACAAYIERESGNLSRAIELFELAERRSLEAPFGEEMPIDPDEMIRQRRALEARRALDDRFGELAQQMARVEQLGDSDEAGPRELFDRLRRMQRELEDDILEFTGLETYRPFQQDYQPRIARLQRRLADVVNTARVNSVLAQAQRHVGDDEFDEARELLNEIRDEDIGLSEEQRRQMTQLRRQMERTETVRDVRDRAQRRLSEAENEPENPRRWEQAIEAYQQWIETEPDREADLTADIRRFEANTHFARGLQLLERSPQSAEAAFVEADQRGHAEARRYIDDIRAGRNREAQLRRGRDALGQQRYEDAIEALRQAQDLRDDADVQRLLVEARIGLAMRRGREALEQRRLDEAQRQFERVLDLDPQHAQAPRLLDDVARWENYLRLKQSGDEAMANRNYGAARRHFREAREYVETDEIEQRIQEAGYQTWMLAARGHIDRGEWDQARAALRQAISIKGTDEARQMLDDVEQRLRE